MEYHPAISKGKVAVVTGAASGIGFAAAQRFGEAEMRLLLVDRDEERLLQAKETLSSQGLTVQVYTTDVGIRTDFPELKERAKHLGDVSVLMNNAGRGGKGRILGCDEEWDEIVGTNLMGPIYGVQTFLPDMLEADWPCAIVNTGSKQGITLPPGNTVYNVSKAGLKAFSESLAHDLLPTRGRITAHLLIPGFTFTGFVDRTGRAEKPAAAWTPDQVIDFMLPAMSRGEFYIVCPDNEVDRSLDVKRFRWTADDIILNRPPLSRWHPDFSEAFNTFVAQE